MRRYGIRLAPQPAASSNAPVSSAGSNNSVPAPGKGGPIGLTVTKLAPLYLQLTLESVVVTDSGPKYVIGVQNEARPTARERSKKQYYCAPNKRSSTDVFRLQAVKEAGDNLKDAVLVLELTDTGEKVELSAAKPYKRAEGYSVDLEYAPEQKVWKNCRVGQAPLHLNGDEYTITAITPHEVVLTATSNQKQWSVSAKAE